MLANHKKWIFLLKRAFLGESQRPVRRLSNQISSFRLETHWSFLTDVQLTLMLHYRIHGFLRTEFQNYAFLLREKQFRISHFASIWKTALALFAPL